MPRSTGYISLVIAFQAAPAAVAVDGRGQGACRRGRIDLALGVDRRGLDPDVVLAAAGMVPTDETLAAVDLLATDVPDLRVRIVNVMDLMRLESPLAPARSSPSRSTRCSRSTSRSCSAPWLSVRDPPADLGAP